MSVIIWDFIPLPTAPLFALKSDNSFGVCLSNCDINVDSSDMPLILRNSSQICKEEYTILVTYQKWYVFFWFKSFGYKLFFEMKNMDSVKQLSNIHYTVVL